MNRIFLYCAYLLFLNSFVFPVFSENLRIVTLAPNLTEIIYALNLQQYLVGNTKQCDYPAETDLLYKVGDYTSPNIERILNVKPNFVIATMGNPRILLNKLKILGMRVIEVPDPLTLDDLSHSISSLSIQLGHEEEGKILTQKIKTALDQSSAGIKRSSKKILFVLQFNPLYSVSEDTWIGNLFEYAGFQNVVGKSQVKYPILSQEYLIAHPPDLVFVSSNDSLNHDQNETYVESQLKIIFGSVIAKRIKIVFIPKDIFVRPGPRVIEAIRFLRNYGF
jgi:iron complex transport system substrate-binding protein